ncbi:hypothetical protein B9Z55_004105 [Caenorhabditis nigoni]|uniref:Uncharacterized protein n=1 Tax=Caenorhabditis nigoni TaxID=1611254 RepID=A0A2G5UUY1_9PELO|nr:hypothetical protein B9Z55_004105 [Caenorhabditis nigoni]
MSQPTCSTQLAPEAVEALLRKNIRMVHLNFNEECVLREDFGRVTVSVPVKEIYGRYTPSKTALKTELRKYGEAVVLAAYQIGQSEFIDAPITHYSYLPVLVPNQDETVAIRGEVAKSESPNPKLQYAITVYRKRINVVGEAIGFL